MVKVWNFIISAGNFRTTEGIYCLETTLEEVRTTRDDKITQDQTFIDFSLHMILFCRNLWLKQSNSKMRLLLESSFQALAVSAASASASQKLVFFSVCRTASGCTLPFMLPYVPLDPHQMTPHLKKTLLVWVFCEFCLHIKKGLPQKNGITQILVASIKTVAES